MDEMPYEEVTDDAYAEVAAAFDVSSPAPGTLLLAGRCPRCAAEIRVPVIDGVFKNAGRFRRAPAERMAPMICTCAEEHPGRPPGRIGCGAYWLLRITAGAR
ncbi:hypothetical protein [Actinoplanes sp. NPDC026619]|uniref:hypothetical protein n=1 Tax=Actinoplanes sp. NPDC026619 TaxID=3155798 RepID=UPI00340045BE